MIGKVLLFAMFACVAVSAEWEWKKNDHAVECQKKVMGDHWDQKKTPCMIVCTGHEEGFFHKDNTLDTDGMKKWINHLHIEDDKKESLLKAFPSCMEVGKGLEDCEAGAKVFKCMKEHGGHFPEIKA